MVERTLPDYWIGPADAKVGTTDVAEIRKEFSQFAHRQESNGNVAFVTMSYPPTLEFNVDAACAAIAELRVTLAAATVDAARYRLARSPQFGIACWTPYAKPLIATGESADQYLDTAR